MMTYDETVAVCALNKIFGYHPILAAQLVQQTGSALSLFQEPLPERTGHPELFSQLNPSKLEWAAGELERVQRGGFRFLTLWDDDYPAPLKDCPDPPLGLYLNGSTPPAGIFGFRPMIAFVGTRDLSPYGKAWCQKLVMALAQARVQPAIVSGLAFGADGVAHQTALDCGLPTIGVMATGIDAVYPWQHERLAMSIVQSPGSGLLTDYPLDTSPQALNFLRRNRIIAGLVSAVVVVESKTKGGSLMTARYANEYARDVYALPGRADDLRSAGCNSLIHEHMADIITTPEQLVLSLGLGGPVRRARKTAEDQLLKALEASYCASSELIPLALAIREHRGAGPEELTALVNQPFPAVLQGIGRLEADGYVTTDLLRRCSLAAQFS